MFERILELELDDQETPELWWKILASCRFYLKPSHRNCYPPVTYHRCGKSTDFRRKTICSPHLSWVYPRVFHGNHLKSYENPYHPRLNHGLYHIILSTYHLNHVLEEFHIIRVDSQRFTTIHHWITYWITIFTIDSPLKHLLVANIYHMKHLWVTTYFHIKYLPPALIMKHFNIYIYIVQY